MDNRISFFSRVKAFSSPLIIPSVIISITSGCSVHTANQQSGFEYVDPAALMADERSSSPTLQETQAASLDEDVPSTPQSSSSAEIAASSPQKSNPDIVGALNMDLSEDSDSSQVSTSEPVQTEGKIADSLKRQAEIQSRIAALESSIAEIEQARQGNSSLTVNQEKTISVDKLENGQGEDTGTSEIDLPEDAENEELIAKVNRLQERNPTAAGIRPALLTKASDSILAISQKERDFFKSLQASVIKSNKTKQNYGLEWQVVQKWENRLPNGCDISSPTVQIEDKDYATQVWLDVIDNQLKVNTTTNLDIRRPGVGIRVDGAGLKQFSSLDFQSNAYWSGDLTETLKNNNSLTIVLGGNELGRKRHQTTINLNGLKAVYADYLDCEKARSLVKR